MSTQSSGWLHCLDVMHHADPDTFEHRLADELSGADDDRAWTLLVDIITEDAPAEHAPATHEYIVAGRLLHHLTEVSA